MDFQSTDEWLKNQDANYHKRQFKKIYRNTVFFCDFLESCNVMNRGSVLDIGAGLGANLKYMSERFPKVSFTGIDLNSRIIELGNSYLKSFNVTNVKLIAGDLYNIDPSLVGKYNGVITYQTYSHFPDYKTPLKKMAEIKPEWIAFNALCYDGPIHATIQIQDFSKPFEDKKCLECFYNIYSIELVKKEFEKNGYNFFKYIPFEIDIDLPKPEKKGMGTYTVKTTEGQRLQISGPILMNWYFIFASREEVK